MTIALLVSAAALLLVYTLYFARYTIALYRFDPIISTINEKEYPFLSLIIPLRNEDQNLQELFNSLIKQEYPRDRFEVLFIDDHSEDDSSKLLDRVCDQYDNFYSFNLPESATGKKSAVDMGVLEAKGEWIVQTDADCNLPSGFLLSHANTLSSGKIDFIAGPVKLKNSRGLWSNLESLEFLSLIASGMASFQAKRPALCSAVNMSYSKELYNSVRTKLAGTSSPSGDDVFLLAAAKSMKKNVAYTFNKDAIVEAKPSGGFFSFMNQRIRWGSKAKEYQDRDQLSLTLIVWFTNLFLSVLLCCLPFKPDLFLPFVSFFLIKALVDFIFLRRAASLLNQTWLMYYFPLLSLFYYFYISVTGLLSIVGRFRWKQRSYNTKPAKH